MASVPAPMRYMSKTSGSATQVFETHHASTPSTLDQIEASISGPGDPELGWRADTHINETSHFGSLSPVRLLLSPPNAPPRDV